MKINIKKVAIRYWINSEGQIKNIKINMKIKFLVFKVNQNIKLQTQKLNKKIIDSTVYNLIFYLYILQNYLRKILFDNKVKGNHHKI